MPTLPRDIATLICADKELAFVPKRWDEADKNYFEVLVPLTAGEVTIGGFFVRVKISRGHLSRDAMAQLEFGQTRRTSEPLWRLDWKPLHRHDNKGDGAPGYEWGEYDRVSHDHNFWDNFVPQRMEMRRTNLPRARPFDIEPGTVSDFLDFSGKCFRINNLSAIALPTATIDLYWQKSSG